ncbi:hypothetical protein GCM10010405_44070 [Streptomyces macrosporus]|uniref:Transposase n=1 Tax=Streptomyces macrosporus TaxID=44032 RepID=A0ABN3KBS8_9ACTN
MDAHEVNRVRAKSALYAADVFASVPGKGQRAKGDRCLRGLMPDGRRTSTQTMTARLPNGNEQNPRQSVNQSTGDPVPCLASTRPSSGPLPERGERGAHKIDGAPVGVELGDHGQVLA